MSKKTTKADEAETATSETATAEADTTEGLVKMHKHGEHLHVHPTTVKAHKEAGWELA